MKIVIIIIMVLSQSFFVTSLTDEEFIQIDDYTDLDIKNEQPDETIPPEIDDGYEEAEEAEEQEEEEPKIDMGPIQWIDEHLIETILWSIIGILSISLIGIACCLFDVSHLLFDLLRTELDQNQNIQLQPVQHV